MNKVTPRPLSFEEELAVSAYEKATSDALSAADSAAEKLITAAFSIATAYGALIALVAPEDDTSSWILGLPFVPLMIAAIAAMFARTRGVDVDLTNEIDKVMERVEDAVKAKRTPSWIALGFMVLAVAVAGWIVVDRYSGGETLEVKSVTIWVTQNEAQRLAGVCGEATASISGESKVDALGAEDPFLAVKPSMGSCGSYVEVRVRRGQVVAITSES